MKRITIGKFIESNRDELIAAILKSCPNCEVATDDAIEEWIMNEEGLYLWAKSEGVDVDGEDEDES